MSDTTPPVRPDDAGEQADRPPVLQPAASDGVSGADAASAPTVRPRQGAADTTA
ncbi:hypothetical protein GCM10025783_11110 [Amnibacterium soli]|uniref:Uncharacterized protein n=1 Tax=Amnibacterium soli TaxID=1282736 RepID=A0ABP8YWL0_9MICO